MKKTTMRLVAVIACATVVAAVAQAQQTTLRAPSRTIYKCVQGKTVSYSDEPCLGAQRLEVEPTRGVSKISGKERIGKDVSHERWREGFADALMPISGMNAKQLDVARRRQALAVGAQRECATLDAVLFEHEAQEKAAVGNARPMIQQVLFEERKRYRLLRC